MPKEEGIQVEGIVRESLSNAKFRVELEHGHMIIAHPCGKMRRFFIQIMPGDAVSIELSPYDLSQGRITYRHKQ